MTDAIHAELAELGSATVYEAGGRKGYVDADLGFSAADRAENVRRVGEVARLFADVDLVIVATCSPEVPLPIWEGWPGAMGIDRAP